MSMDLVVPSADEAVVHLSKAIQFRTISYKDPSPFDKEEFVRLHTYLEKVFPNVHAILTKEVINECSLLYTWEGTDPDCNCHGQYG
jgi:carboxypeptidase PM20D1